MRKNIFRERGGRKTVFLLSQLILFSLLIGSFVFFGIASGEKTGSQDIIKKMPRAEFVSPETGVELEREIKIKVKIEGASSVEFYLRKPESLTEIYSGSADSQGKDSWEYLWNTTLTPNGEYYLFPKITNQYGEYKEKKINVQVKNEVKKDEEDEEKEKELKKKIEENKKEIEQEDEGITKKEKETKEKIIKETEDLTEKAEKIIEKEKKEKVESEVREKVEKVKKESEKDIKELTEKIKKEENSRKEIEKQESAKKVIEQKTEQTKEALEKIQETKKRAKETQKEIEVEKAKNLEDIKKASLENLKEEKEKIEEKINSLKKRFEKIKEEKKLIKEGVSQKILETIEPIEKKVSVEKKPQISEIKKKTEERVGSHLEELEEEVLIRERKKEEIARKILKDSDNDNLSDAEEIRLGTDPFNPDTDQDGFLDGIEIAEGYDPLKPSPADKIVYQDPRKVEAKEADIYKTEKVKTVILPSGKLGIKLTGRGRPNSFVTIYVFSPLLVLTTKTNENGYWEYIIDKPLEEGEHEVYVAVTNNQGKIVARSETFKFIKTLTAVAAIAPSSEKVISSGKSLQKNFLILVVSIIALTIGIALIVIGILTKRAKKGSPNL